MMTAERTEEIDTDARRNSSATGNGGGHGQTPLRVIQTYRVQPGCESAWEEAVRSASADVAGQSEFVILPPTKTIEEVSDNEWRVGRHFDKVETYERWWDGDARHDSEQKISGWLLSAPTTEVLTGLGAWYAPDNGQKTITPPPQWKTTLLGFASFFPLALALSYAMEAVFGKDGLPLPVKTLFLSGILVPLDKYIVSPLVAKVAGQWLYPPPK